MAKLLMCCVFDVKVGSFSPPFCVKTKGEAIRSFTDACSDDKLPFAKHLSDYHLYCVGEFDDNAGVLVSVQPEQLIRADQVEIGR